MGLDAKSYMRKGFLIYEKMHKYFHHIPVCSANDEPVRIQYKCLVPFMFSRNETVQPPYFQNRIIMFCLPIPTLIYSICEGFIYFQVSLPILLQGNTVCGPILGIYKSLTDT